MRGLLSLVIGLTLVATVPAQNVKGIEFFETKIRPVLAQHCYACHSQEAQKNKKLRGELFLDSSAGLRKGGASGPVVVPGKSKESLLVQALRHQGDTKMPPKGKLADDVIAAFAQWIDMGVPDPRAGAEAGPTKVIDIAAGKKYWAFQPLAASAIPAVKNVAWARTPVDRFILARLEDTKLTPNGLVSREKLLRRAYFDLLGLPPTPAEAAAFLNDTAPDAYERLIDRLLASEHYGERWGRHWLDLVRFAESGGYEFDKDRPGAYHYRDFVIKALNQDMPFDEFVRLQVAGDHLQPGDFLATSATGFLVAGPYPGQTTAKTLALIRYNHLDDMLATLGSSVLGLSVGCARCHAHKYDPIPQEDYYRLLACLARTDSADLKIDPNPGPYLKAKAIFDKAHAPFLVVRDQFEKEALPGRVQKWSAAARQQAASSWLGVALDKTSPAPAKGDKTAFMLRATTYLKDITGIRLEAQAGKTLPKPIVVGELTLKAAPLTAKAKEIVVKLKPMAGDGPGEGQATFETEGSVGFDGGTLLTLTISNKGLAPGQVDWSITTAPRPVKAAGVATPQKLGELVTLLDREKGQLTGKNRAGVLHWLRRLDAETDKVYVPLEKHAKQEPKPNLVDVFAATSGRGGDVYFLTRGEVDRKNGKAEPGFIQVLMNTSEREKRWTDTANAKQPEQPRIALARWLTDTEQGAGNLVARVLVNRLWQHHLGRGIVATSNDFGTQGEPPTHPELLDYLAKELLRHGWRLKALHKLIMTSAVYMQAGEVLAANSADPQNRFWWRYPARRLEAETIRDALLAVSGTLDATMYGPGSLDANNPRRSVYLKVKRSQMVPFMQMFDAPEAIQSIGERSTTTVATQSLAFLNSPLVRQRATRLAQRLRPKTPAELPQAIDDAYVTALSRHVSGDERQRMVSFVQKQMAAYGQTPQALDQALTDFCQVVLCLNEFVYVD